MKKIRFGMWLGAVCLVLVLIAGLAGACSKPTPATSPAPAPTPAPAPESQPVTLRLAIQSFPAEPITIAIDDLAKNFNARAAGKAEIVVYGGGSLGLSPQYLEMVRTGAVDMADIPLGHAATDSPICGAIDLPFLLNNVQARAAAIKPMADQVFNRVFESQFNQKSIAYSPLPFQDIGSTKKPVKTMEDMEGMLIAAASAMQIKIVNILGGSPVEVPGPEVYGALEKGVVDGILLPVDAAMAMSLFEIMPYWTVACVHTAYTTVNINLASFNKLPTDVQSILLEEAEKFDGAITKSIEAAEIELTGALQQAGMEFYELPAAERERWRQACLPLWDEFVAKVGPDAEKIISIAEEINKQYP